MKKLVLSLVIVLSLAVANGAAVVDSGTLLVLNKSDNTVSLIDLSSKKVVATIPTGVGPHEVAVSPDGKTAVVANYCTAHQEPPNTQSHLR